MLSHMAFLYQFKSHHNEPMYYYRISFTFFCSEFAAYIRRNTVSYGFYDKIFMLNQGLPKNKGHNMALQKWIVFISRTEKWIILISQH